ncbi:hypothetical protein [Tolumonas lignilytica]|uniref:hypothetical protein n=1 Tax=Tolumonas lignilytica TaxID=1283284 RepID=UPI000466C322|nr:hypothetical protein [Tolumonas lignilytica]
MSNQDKLEIAKLTLHYLISIQTSENATHALRRLEAEAGRCSDPDTFGALYQVVFKEIEVSVATDQNNKTNS